MFQMSTLILKVFDFFNIGRFHPAILCLPVVIAGLRNSGLTAHILDGTSGFDELQNGDDLVFSESDLTHSVLLRGYNKYIGRSLKVNGTETGVLTLEFATALKFSRIGFLIRLVVAHHAKIIQYFLKIKEPS